MNSDEKRNLLNVVAPTGDAESRLLAVVAPTGDAESGLLAVVAPTGDAEHRLLSIVVTYDSDLRFFFKIQYTKNVTLISDL